jgi:hypothetical protein
MKPANWPRYMIEKRLRSGAVAYYWNPPVRDLEGGFTLDREPLGQDLSAACERADVLNEHLLSWRAARNTYTTLDLQPGYGTLDWLVARYYRSRAFEKLTARSQPNYRHTFKIIVDIELKDGRRAGTLRLAQVTAAFVDKVYAKVLQRGPRQAALCIALMRRAWKVVQRLHPKVVPASNPWVGVIQAKSAAEEIVPASREDAYALSKAIADSGHPHLAAVPIICFEWLQRPENVLAGHLSWGDVRPADRPHHVRIDHHKTGKKVLQPLEDAQGRLFPELEDYLAKLPRLGLAVVLTPGRRGEPRPYSFSYAKRIAREARRKAGLPEYLTMTACRHGGMTELGDAALTEAQTMALSGHKTPDAARLYVKRTDAQRVTAARRRRGWVESERSGDKSQNGGDVAVSE